MCELTRSTNRNHKTAVSDRTLVRSLDINVSHAIVPTRFLSVSYIVRYISGYLSSLPVAEEISVAVVHRLLEQYKDAEEE